MQIQMILMNITFAAGKALQVEWKSERWHYLLMGD